VPWRKLYPFVGSITATPLGAVLFLGSVYRRALSLGFGGVAWRVVPCHAVVVWRPIWSVGAALPCVVPAVLLSSSLWSVQLGCWCRRTSQWLPGHWRFDLATTWSLEAFYDVSLAVATWSPLRRLLRSGYLVTGGLTSRLPGRWRLWSSLSPSQWLPGHWRFYLATSWLLEVLVDALPPWLDPPGWRPLCGCISCGRHNLVFGSFPLVFLLCASLSWGWRR